MDVRPVDPSLAIQHVCIQENPKVVVGGYLQVLRDGFDRHGISTEVFSGGRPANCEYMVTYTAFQHWDLGLYLTHAEIRIEKDGRYLASAQYHLNGNGGLSLTKWQSTKTKMDPVIDSMLKK